MALRSATSGRAPLRWHDAAIVVAASTAALGGVTTKTMGAVDTGSEHAHWSGHWIVPRVGIFAAGRFVGVVTCPVWAALTTLDGGAA